MQIKFLKKDGFDYNFLVQNTRNDILNALRRTMLLHVPVFAVKSIAVYKNEGVMPDEMLAHRIGLVPIDSNDVDDKEHHLALKKTSGTVYSGDIEGSLDIPLKNIPLNVLNDNKTLELELLVTKGTGEEHAKYIPANVFFHNVVNIKQNANVEDIEKLCPLNLLDKKANTVFLKDPYSCNLCRFCESKTKHVLELVYNNSEFVFTIEPFGQLNLGTLVKGAVEHLTNELNELKAQLKEKPKKVVSQKTKKTKAKKTTKK